KNTSGLSKPERESGIEHPSSAWKAEDLPLNYTRLPITNLLPQQPFIHSLLSLPMPLLAAEGSFLRR
ncbi:MAG: hypothetical protein V3V56_02800, partial [bacterium]